MPAIYEKCPESVLSMAADLLCSYEGHKPLLDHRVKIDFIFASAEVDEKTGKPKGWAIKVRGLRALGQTRKTNLKDRVMGRGDAEVILDKDWWEAASPDEQRAVLDHELWHIAVKAKAGRDDAGRPKIELRLHDYEFGFFTNIAARHGRDSAEVQLAKMMWDEAGQAYWPDLWQMLNTPTAPPGLS